MNPIQSLLVSKMSKMYDILVVVLSTKHRVSYRPRRSCLPYPLEHSIMPPSSKVLSYASSYYHQHGDRFKKTLVLSCCIVAWGHIKIKLREGMKGVCPFQVVKNLPYCDV